MKQKGLLQIAADPFVLSEERPLRAKENRMAYRPNSGEGPRICRTTSDRAVPQAVSSNAVHRIRAANETIQTLRMENTSFFSVFFHLIRPDCARKVP